MFNRFLTTRVCLVVVLCCTSFQGQEIQPEQKARVDAAVPRKAPATPKQPRRMLVTNLSMRDGKPVRGSSAAAIPSGNYAIQQMGKVTGAYEAVFSDDIDFRRRWSNDDYAKGNSQKNDPEGDGDGYCASFPRCDDPGAGI